MAKLVLNPHSPSRRDVPLPRTILSIGRDPSNDLVLPDAMVSRRHALIEYRGSQFFLRDCNSSNGSLVNGDRVTERSLRDGDLVAIGSARLLFREEADVRQLIKMKGIYELLESVTDRCEDVANIVEGIILENS